MSPLAVENGSLVTKGGELCETCCDAPPGTCSSDCDCPAGQICVNGQCTDYDCEYGPFAVPAEGETATGVNVDEFDEVYIYILGCKEGADQGQRDITVIVDGVELDSVSCDQSGCTNGGFVDITVPGELTLAYPNKDVDVCFQIIRTPPEWGVCCLPPDHPTLPNSCVPLPDRESCEVGEGGTFYPGAECRDPGIPCGSGVCCLPDGRCIDGEFEDQCVNVLGGVFFQGQTCDGFDCTASLTGACCYTQDGTNWICEDGITAEQCAAKPNVGVNFYPNKTCGEIDCPELPPVGACCYLWQGVYQCSDDTTLKWCEDQDTGVWHPGKVCGEIDCPELPPPVGNPLP